ncbi:TonB-dependent receptor domain-containing protein [Luteimonas dalianensis]|uniref:TonB-dependent receptor domain-containing protein n=1 Tax=Luteimonas dalianensis TaxID=1148196 RepID=UPI003BF3BDF6
MKAQHQILTLAVALALSPAAAASSLIQATDLDEVVVTGTRTEVLLTDSLVPAQVIDREEIERTQATDLVGLLRGRAGVDISNQGGRGKLSSLFLRGAESDHVLVLVDGIKIGSATSGMAAFQDLALSQIERIEIVRGPRSSLYGAEAIGGVIQIFTRGDDAEGFAPHLSLGAGSNATREVSGGFNYRGQRGWLGAHGGYQRTDGFNACRGSAELFAGCWTDEPDDDGYRSVSMNVRGGMQLTEALALEGSFLDIAGENEYDGTWTNRSKTRQQVSGATLEYAPQDGRLALKAAVGRSKDRSNDYHEDVHMSTFETRRDSASVQADVRLAPAHLLSLGVDWSNDVLDSTTAYSADERDNTGVFVGYDGGAGRQRWQASLRHDDNEQFGSHTTGSLGWGLSFDSGLRLNATVGTGFKAPTFNDLYYPGSESPWLQPEKSTSLNLGVSQATEDFSWSFNLYESRIDNLIVFTYEPPTFQGVGANVDEARIRGAEATFGTSFAGFDLSTQLSYTDPRDRSGGFNDDNLLARRARASGRIDLDRGFGPVRAGITVQGAGSRYDDAANSVRLGGYATADLRLEYAFHRDWTLLARAGNVFDRDYETIAWYNQPGREYGLTLRWRPAP